MSDDAAEFLRAFKEAYERVERGDAGFEFLRGWYEAGERKALLLAILYAAMFRHPIPDWAADAFKEAYERVERGDAGSWDDVFGRPHPAGKQLRSIRLEHLRFKVWGLVRYFHEREGRPIGEGLFEYVGKMTGLGHKTTIGELYYEAERAMRGVKIDVVHTDTKLPRK